MRKRWNEYFLYSPDDGSDGSGSGADITPDGGGSEGGREQKLPAYFSQFKKENREKYTALSKCRSIDELADLALKGDSYKEPDYSGYVKMPTGESTKEELREFLTKLGVPEGPDKYSLPAEKDAEPFVQGVEKTLREAAFRSGMTDSQVKSMWGVVRAMIDTAKNEGEKYQADRKDNFDARYEKLFDSYSQDAQKSAAIKESLGYFSTFLTETGIGKILTETGAIYDENLVKALADYQKKNRGKFNSGSGSSGGKEPSRGLMKYSKEFYDEFDKKR